MTHPRYFFVGDSWGFSNSITIADDPGLPGSRLWPGDWDGRGPTPRRGRNGARGESRDLGQGHSARARAERILRAGGWGSHGSGIMDEI